ncbi:hypothetical protein MD484_g3578, partial [Candolleomyces efflorescens]
MSASLTSSPGSSLSEQSQLDITARNRSIFRRYAKTFANLADPTFAEHAAKFAVWLSNQRGYYEAARPEIMHNAIRKAVGYRETQQVPLPLEAYRHLPMSSLYIQLVKTVYRFASIFTEPNLQRALLLKGLFFSVNLPYTPTPANIEAVQAPVPGPSAPVGTLHPAPGLVPQQYVLTPTQILEAVQSSQSALHAANPLSVKTEASHPADLASGSAGPRVKKRKRKTLDLESLAEMDLKSYIEKQEKVQTQDSGSGKAVLEDLPTVPKASSDPGVSQHQPTAEGPVPPLSLDEIMDFPESPVNVLAEPIVKGEPVEAVIPPTAPGQPPPSGAEVVDLTLSDDDEPSANPDAMQVDEQPNPPEASTTLDNLPPANAAEGSPIPSDSQPPSEEVPQDTSELALTNEAVGDADGMDIDSGSSALIPEPLPPEAILLEETTIPQIIEEETTIPQVVEEDTAISQEISTTGQAFVEDSLPQSTAQESPLTIDGGEAHAESTLNEPVLNGARMEEEEEEEEEEVMEEQKSEHDPSIADERIYGNEMKVVACRRGLKSNGLIRFTFDMGENYLESILAWSKNDAPIA